MRDVIFPSTVGVLVRALRAGFTALDDDEQPVGWIRPKLPTAYGMALVPRMITVSDAGGPDDGPQTRRRHGFNVWAPTTVEAESRALRAMAILRSAADGSPITLIDQLSGPAEVDDVGADRLALADGAELAHYFFTARVTARGARA